jgi:hypothetical protein
LVEQINQGKVKTVAIKGNELSITLKDEKKEKASKESESSLTETLANYGVDKDRLKEVSLAVEEPSGASYWATLLLPFLLPFLLIAGFIWFMMRQAQRGNSQALSFGMSKARILDPADKRKRITFKDIEKLGRNRNFIIYDTDDQEKLMKNVLKEMHIEDKELKARAALGYVSRFKCELLTPKQAMVQATTARMQQVGMVYQKYQAALVEANALDFDDLILETVRLFQEVPEVLDHYQETWRFLHVDEYQDTNHAQYLFISLLAQKYRNLCVIGDPDQSIYAFRGADIRNILEFLSSKPWCFLCLGQFYFLYKHTKNLIFLIYHV